MFRDFYDFIQKPAPWDTIIVDLWVSHSVNDKIRLFYNEVRPLNDRIRQIHPRALTVYHGFDSVSDIHVTSREMVDYCAKTNPYGVR